jgi:hypothetical protein
MPLTPRRDPEELNQLARAAAKRAVAQVKAGLPHSESCPDCGQPIAVTYVEPPGDSFTTACGCFRSRFIFRGVLGPPKWILDERALYVQRAAGAALVDAAFYADHFNTSRQGEYFECPIDLGGLAPGASDEDKAKALRLARRLNHGPNAYVGSAYFKYPGEKLGFEDAVKKLKRDNPGFCEDVYRIVIDDNIRGMR